MILETLPLADLAPAPHNPRVPLKPGDAGWEKLAASVRSFGLVQPLVYNRRTGRLVGGHQRLEVLKHDGETHAPCVVVDLPDAREKALCVALNNAEVGGAWDGAKLTDLLGELRDAALHPTEDLGADFDAALTGFDAGQLDAMLMTPACLPGDSSNDFGGRPGRRRRLRRRTPRARSSRSRWRSPATAGPPSAPPSTRWWATTTSPSTSPAPRTDEPPFRTPRPGPFGGSETLPEP